jgi:uncharacterized protein YcfJ
MARITISDINNINIIEDIDELKTSEISGGANEGVLIGTLIGIGYGALAGGGILTPISAAVGGYIGYNLSNPSGGGGRGGMICEMIAA